jgi:cerevisin
MTHLFQWSLLTASIVASVFATPLSTSSVVYANPSPLTIAPLVVSDHPHGTVNNSYIVMLKDDLPTSLMQNHINFLMAAHDADPLVGDDMAGISQIYDGHIKGYAGRFTTNVLDQIRRMPEVEYVEKDQIVRTQDIIQKAAPWVSYPCITCYLAVSHQCSFYRDLLA